jgi:hypothetical protein
VAVADEEEAAVHHTEDEALPMEDVVATVPRPTLREAGKSSYWHLALCEPSLIDCKVSRRLSCKRLPWRPSRLPILELHRSTAEGGVM